MARLIIHPGEHLADELEALGMSANELAKELGVPTNRITEIIRGKRGISGDTALRLGRWFGRRPEWVTLPAFSFLASGVQECPKPTHCLQPQDLMGRDGVFLPLTKPAFY